MWILLALLSALFAATRRTSEKRLSADLHHFTIGWMIQLLSLPVIVTAMLLFGQTLNPFALGWKFWLPLAAVSIGFYPANIYLYFTAIKHNDLSKVLPIQSLWPVFTLIPAWIILHEIPTALAVLGIVLVVAGVYALGLKGKALHRPWQPFVEDKSSRYMLLSVVLTTIVGVVDKIAIGASNALFYSFMSTVGAVIMLLVAAVIIGSKEWHKLRPEFGKIGILGTLQGSSYSTYLLALSIGPAAYVSAIRSSNVLIGSLLGIFLLKEAFTTNKKISFALIAAGSLLLAFG